MGLRDPHVRVAPDGGAVFREDDVERGVRQRRRLGAGVDQRELDPVLGLELACGGQLLLGQVEPDGASAEAREPGAPVTGPAAEVEHVETGHVRKDPQLLLRDLPHPPPRRGARPRLAPALDPIRSVGVPDGAVAGGVGGEVEVVGRPWRRSLARPRLAAQAPGTARRSAASRLERGPSRTFARRPNGSSSTSPLQQLPARHRAAAHERERIEEPRVRHVALLPRRRCPRARSTRAGPARRCRAASAAAAPPRARAP